MLSLNEIAEAIEGECDKLEGLIDQVAEAAYRSAIAETDFKLKFAEQRIMVRDDAAAIGKKVTIDQVEDAATLTTIDERRDHLLASGTLSAVRDAVRVAQSRVDAYRTLAASFRQAGG